MGDQQSNSEKKDLLLLHGALGAASQIEPLGSHLSDEFQTHTISFSGHGGDDYEGPFSIDLFAYDIIQYLDDRQITQADIFGFSMGGYVGLKVAERLGLRIGRVITLGTKFAWDPIAATRETRYLNPERMLEKVPEFASLLKDRHTPGDWKAVVRRTADLINSLGNQPQWQPGVNLIHNPAKIMVGALDTMVTIDETREVAEHLPNAEIRIIPQTEHPFERADLTVVAEEIRSFLS